MEDRNSIIMVIIITAIILAIGILIFRPFDIPLSALATTPNSKQSDIKPDTEPMFETLAVFPDSNKNSGNFKLEVEVTSAPQSFPAISSSLTEKIAKTIESSLENLEHDKSEEKTETPSLLEETISESDIYLLAQVCEAEAGGVGKEEMARCGQVFLNRCNTDYWEFKCCVDFWSTLTHSDAYPETLKRIKNGLVLPSESALEVAGGLLDGSIVPNFGEYSSPEDILWQTGFVPKWRAKVVYHSSWHYFSVLSK